MTFTPPDKAQRLQAIGIIEHLPNRLRKAFQPDDLFDPIPTPDSGDWLAAHSEPGQSYNQFVRQQWNQPTDQRNIIYLQPLGEFPEGKSPPVHVLTKYVSTFYTLKVKTLAPISLKNEAITTRTNPYTNNKQLLTTNILSVMKQKLKSDAFCMMAISMEDLYPESSWNFVFGQASLRERVGVYSLARYDPVFYGVSRDQNYMSCLLKRSCNVLVHEIGHMFGLHHCIYYHCVMNGSNNLQESDARPLHLCPVCLRKLYHSIGFDILERYQNLNHFYRSMGFENEEEWTEKRIQTLKQNGILL